MANSTVTITVNNTSFDSATLTVWGTIAISASPGAYPAHGWTLSFAGLDVIKSNSIPLECDIWSGPAAGTSNSGYQYGYCPGTTRDNGQMTVFTGAAAQSPLAELSAGSTPAGVSGDTIRFKAVFPRL